MDRDEFFAIMSAFPTGVAVVTTLDQAGQPVGLTSSAVTSVSAAPPLLLVCVDQTSRTLPALVYSRRFVVNFLREDAADVSDLFASKVDDKFSEIDWEPAPNGMPLLPRSSLAHAACSTIQSVDAGDHVVLVGEVTSGRASDPDEMPLMYFRRTYGAWPAPAAGRATP